MVLLPLSLKSKACMRNPRSLIGMTPLTATCAVSKRGFGGRVTMHGVGNSNENCVLRTEAGNRSDGGGDERYETRERYEEGDTKRERGSVSSLKKLWPSPKASDHNDDDCP